MPRKRARTLASELSSFDQESVAVHSDADNRSLASLIAEYVTVRRTTLSFFESLPEAALTRTGFANGNPMSVRGTAFHIAGHELHHLGAVVQWIRSRLARDAGHDQEPGQLRAALGINGLPDADADAVLRRAELTTV